MNENDTIADMLKDPAQEQAPAVETIDTAPPAPEPDKGEQPAAPPAAPVIPPGYVPINAVLDEREKRQRIEREVEELRRIREEQTAKAKNPPPDFFTDPDGRLDHERKNFASQLWSMKLDVSEAMTRQAHGDDIVNAARDAFMAEAQKNPALAIELQQAPNPYGFVVEWHKRQSFLAEVGDPDQWRKAQRDAIRAELLAELQQQPQPSPRPVIPGSLAKSPSAAGPSEPVVSGFDRLFGKR